MQKYLLPGLDSVGDSGESSVPISVSCHLSLIVTLDHVPPPHSTIMDMSASDILNKLSKNSLLKHFTKEQ